MKSVPRQTAGEFARALRWVHCCLSNNPTLRMFASFRVGAEDAFAHSCAMLRRHRLLTLVLVYERRQRTEEHASPGRPLRKNAFRRVLAFPRRAVDAEPAVWTNKLKLERQQLPAPPIGTKQFEALRHATRFPGRGVELDLDGPVLRVAGPPQNPTLARAPAGRVGPPIR